MQFKQVHCAGLGGNRTGDPPKPDREFKAISMTIVLQQSSGKKIQDCVVTCLVSIWHRVPILIRQTNMHYMHFAALAPRFEQWARVRTAWKLFIPFASFRWWIPIEIVIRWCPATAVQSKGGAYASPHLHGKRGSFLVWGMVLGFQQKGGVFERESPWIFKKMGYFLNVPSMIVNLNFNHVILVGGKSWTSL